jgi:CheY-like chemotaxis protein
MKYKYSRNRYEKDPLFQGRSEEKMFSARLRGIRFKILVVEAQQDIRLIFQTLNLNWDVRFARTGAKAMQELNTFLPDLVIIDAEMKGSDAHLVARTLKQFPQTHSIPIVFLTSHCDEKCVVYHHRAGADYLIMKPLTDEKLQDVITDLLRARERESAATSPEPAASSKT